MRLKILAWLSGKTTRLHNRLERYNKPWNISLETLQHMPTGSLGHHLALFYRSNRFHPIPTMEYHDVEHLLLNVDTDVKSEMLLQFFCLGNGKRTFFVMAACAGSLLILPEMWFRCYLAYQQGKRYQPIHHTNYLHLLHLPLQQVQQQVFVARTREEVSTPPYVFACSIFKNQ